MPREAWIHRRVTQVSLESILRLRQIKGPLSQLKDTSHCTLGVVLWLEAAIEVKNSSTSLVLIFNAEWLVVHFISCLSFSLSLISSPTVMKQCREYIVKGPFIGWLIREGAIYYPISIRDLSWATTKLASLKQVIELPLEVNACTTDPTSTAQRWKDTTEQLCIKIVVILSEVILIIWSNSSCSYSRTVTP